MPQVHSLEGLFEAIHFRAKVMHEISRLHKGEMAAVKGIDVLRLRELIDHAGLLVDISCDNSPKQQVIGGRARRYVIFLVCCWRTD